MKLSPQALTFKGYDAAPLRRIFVDSHYSEPFYEELKTVGKQESFDIECTCDCRKWIQDDKVIVERNLNPHLVADWQTSNAFISELKYTWGITGSREYGLLTGGNTFIGKLPNGEKWLLMGKNERRICDDPDKISKTYGVKVENLNYLPQQDFHLDMFLRPIGYPYILVNDPKLAKENLEKYCQEHPENKSIMDEFLKWNERRKRHYADCEETIAKLEEIGFIPIRIAGVYTEGINFMNAIVNKHKDGKISYITNSTKGNYVTTYNDIEKIFENDLKNKVPNIDKVHFIAGRSSVDYMDPDIYYTDGNYMMSNIKNNSGGLHCMTLEEPNFEQWA
ncbi:MAG: hypothetical protein IJ003_06780 [Candidatus Gastranaerophilales bacterium]|nr:hypothetical protein [Candidatus Gastranaerophilales bacterium]